MKPDPFYIHVSLETVITQDVVKTTQLFLQYSTVLPCHVLLTLNGQYIEQVL